MRWVGHVAHIRDMRNAYKILVGKPEGKRPLRKCGLDASGSRDQWRVVNTIMNVRVP
jgi:hypothetical protein